MKKDFYVKNFVYGLAFYIFVYVILLLTRQPDQETFSSYFLAFGFISSAFFPFSILTIERISPSLTKPTHWGRWVGFIALLFSIPIGIIGFLSKNK
ncbi:hypothetical protein SC206_02195 [Rouxiella sp. T17]|uniref:hypothetical protein n=1 Tax=Rouxiella sp. T17 TaxID=3085684 RepID=UPI002FC60CDE